MENLKLRCPYCGVEQPYKRDIDPHIPASVATIEIICPNCDDGDFHTETWFDAEGKEVEPV